MRIVDLLSKDSILLNASPKNKAEAIDLLVDLQVKGGKITDRETYKQGILAREENGSTAVGEGIAIPHAKNAAVKAPSLAAMTVPEGVDYEALDDEPSNLLFMIAAPSDGGDVHLEVLSRLMVILMDEDFRAKLLAAESKEAFLQVIDEMEREKYPDEPQEAPKAAPEADGRIKVLAVTACPTGIAHTYMAAEALEKAGKKLGISKRMVLAVQRTSSPRKKSNSVMVSLLQPTRMSKWHGLTGKRSGRPKFPMVSRFRKN